MHGTSKFILTNSSPCNAAAVFTAVAGVLLIAFSHFGASSAGFLLQSAPALGEKSCMIQL